MTDNQAASPCAECRYDYAPLDHSEIVAAVTALADQHRQVLASIPRWQLNERSSQATWSPLEYSCHVRDVLRFQRERVIAAQTQYHPVFEPMRRDERAVEERYNEQDPLVIADGLTAAATLLADELATLDEQGWQRVGVYPWPAPKARTVEWVTRWTAHELAHHLFDIHRLLGSPGPTSRPPSARRVTPLAMTAGRPRCSPPRGCRPGRAISRSDSPPFTPRTPSTAIRRSPRESMAGTR